MAVQSSARNTLDFGAAFGRNAAPAVEREKTMIWLNVGVEDAHGNFINLPLGLAIDTMQPQAFRGQNDEWNQQVAARNELLKMIQDAGASMEPGGETTVGGLQLRLRRINDTAPNVDKNEVKSTLSGISFS